MVHQVDVTRSAAIAAAKNIVLGFACAALGSLTACDGQIGGPAGIDNGSPGATTSGPAGSSGSGSSTGGTVSGGTGVTTGGMPLDCSAQHAPVLHALLLTPSQYDNTISDLVKVGGQPSKNFNDGAAAELDDLAVERRANAAADVALQAVAAAASWSPCMSPPTAAATCEDQIISTIGPQVYRHPLSTSERAELKTLFDAGIQEKDFATGLEWFLTGVLQSPDFLYQIPKLDPGETAGELRPIAPYDLASRLSYFVWDSMPDDPLYAAAAAGDLSDPARLRPSLDRMVKDPRFLRGITGFYSSWLGVGAFREVARDDTGFTTDVVNALQTSLLMGATGLYGGAAPANVDGLFSGTSYYLNAALRSFYGLTGGSATFDLVDMASDERRGILTHPALMALLARPSESNPIARGLFLRRVIMCEDMPPPPAGVVIPPLPPPTPGLSTRDRLDMHVRSPLCATCHNLIDPPGYAFENFDQVGRRRTNDNGKPIDTSAPITSGGDLSGSYATGAELLTQVAKSEDVKACFAQKYFEYGLSRDTATDDACSLDGLKKSFVPSGDLVALVASIATTDSFRFRTSEGGQ